jgi:hypothetical protein
VSAEDALIALEEKVLSTVRIGGWLAAVADLRVLLATESPGIRRALFALYAPKVEASAIAAVAEAFGLGRADALGLMGDSGAKLRKKTKRRVASKEAREPVKGLDSEGVVALAAAYTLARAGADPATFLAPVFGHADRIQRRVSDAINRGGNEGTTVVADAAGVPTVWVAERNACVHCLAYAGQVCDPGKAFPGGLTYGKKSYYPTSIKTPPRHFRCRCVVEPLNSPEYAVALKREAQRSILRGISLESESMGVRIDATKRLLASGVDAPKSVISYAEKSVRAGRFETRGRPKADRRPTAPTA